MRIVQLVFVVRLMISRQKCKFFNVVLLIPLICLPHTASSLATAPVDFLVPPSPPQNNAAAAVRFKHANPQNFLPSESRTVPKFVDPPLPENPNVKHPGLLTRVARWFGFEKQNVVTDQQMTAGTNKQSYYYPKPQQQQQHGDKENCYLCNKFPWVPMMLNSIQYPPAGNQWDFSKQAQLQNFLQNYPGKSNGEQNSYNNIPSHQQNSYGGTVGNSLPQIQHSASNVRQRAVKFNFPLPYIPPNKQPDGINHVQYSTGPFLPIPIPPLLSNSALPPMYNAQNFLPPPISQIPNTIQELPLSEQAQFPENIAENSEIHVDTIPTQIPPSNPNKDASFEIVKSHQVVDYVSSIEYPASYVPSHSYDISTQTPVVPEENQNTNSKVNTGLYQYSTFSPNLSQHIPASQILTEPGSFTVTNQQQYNQDSEVFEQTTVNNSLPNYEDDNYVAASHKNSSVFDHPQHNANFDAWTLESNDYVYAASTPEAFSSPEDTTTFTTELESTTQPQTQDNEIEFIASIQTNAQHTDKEVNKFWSQKSKQRETPKRLLDSPIQHVKGNFGAPRPFTRDPSDLTFRLSLSNHKMSDTKPETSSNKTWTPETLVTESPIYSSTFSSIDASGQYAGMSPPSLPSTYNSDQILLPYLNAKNQPRPFETTRVNMITKSPSITSYSIWSQAQNAELHTPEESMLIKSHVKPAATTTTTTVKPRTTKYLTKILASNLRELLQREHAPTKLIPRSNSLDIDINKLQKNIDDWTEQEYTSLSHRPSTPTIRGRSKNIPFAYLPTTLAAAAKATRQPKTSKSFTQSSELPSSINNLEPLYARESTKRYQYTQITDNHLRDFYTNFESLKSQSSSNFKSKTKAAPTTTTTSATTTEKVSYLQPKLLQEPEELWKKAKVSISPKTQEKVYVVTPQPRFFPQRFYGITEPSASPSTENPNRSLSLGSGFKSPRFLVRPTPGNAHKLSTISDTLSKENSKENSSNNYITPEWFGLKGLSAYVPSEPVEIIDGNSKVANIVTPSSNLEVTTRHNIMDLTKDRHTAPKRKSTMAPSPR